MNRQILVIVVLIIAGLLIFLATRPFRSHEARELTVPLPSISPTNEPLLAERAWITFENYLEFAKAHDLAGLRSISHQISATCNDPTKEKECFALMDSIYTIGSYLELNAFKHLLSDERQILMYTDGPTVAMLFFTRDDNGTPKVLGMKLCQEDESTKNTCVKPDSIKKDTNQNGWWDSVESIFYPTATTTSNTSNTR